ncbi:MAG: two-component regulator propeller domain-containing protein [Bacteroidota bacterium]|nr:two-component regulator propeller domain-containing protein [Bacteroidota bacterium]
MKKCLLIIMCFFAIQLEAQTITNYTTADGLISDFVECIDVDQDDNVWFGTSVGVQMYDAGDWYMWNQANFPEIVSDNIKSIKAISSGEIWIGTDYGANQLLYGIPASVWAPYTTANGLISNQVKSIDEDPNGDVWIGTNQGVSYFDGNSWMSYSSPDLHWSGVNITAFDSNGDKWFASPLGGVTHFDGTTFTNYNTSNGLLSQNVTALLIDNQDNKWIGTDLGMSVLNASNTSCIDYIEMYSLPPPHDSINPVVDIAMDSYGRIWTAIYVGYLAEGGIAYWNGSQWEDFHVSDGLAGPNVRGLAIDSEDNVWVATSTGVSKISAMPSAVNETAMLVVNIFPNPTSNMVYLSNDGKDIQQVKIYNNLGVLIYEENQKKEQYSIDFSSCKKGLYYVNIQFSDGAIIKKIVVN